MNIAKNLKFLRLEEGMTQQTLADQIGLKRQVYSHYETGKREPSLQSANILCKFFKISLDELVCHDLEREKRMQRLKLSDIYKTEEFCSFKNK